MRCPKSTLDGRYGEEFPDLIAFVCKTGHCWRLGLGGRATSATGLGYGAERYFGGDVRERVRERECVVITMEHRLHVYPPA